jgi:hypothetical protein
VGLAIVDKIVKEWGVTPLARGKEVWCRIPTGFVPARTASRRTDRSGMLHPTP